jgi:protein-S-isoprenylcysteine O-methyltransferase Ste14
VSDMQALRAAITIAWIIFWLYWWASAVGMKAGIRGKRRLLLTGLAPVTVLTSVGIFRDGSQAVRSPVLGAIGAIVFASGITLAVWARVRLGRNWGMPMSRKADAELVTSGPYRVVRHPIYSGLLAGVLGIALVTNLIDLIIVAVLGAYFCYSASVEEKNLTAAFPTAYPVYRTSTKMLVPFVL